MAQPTTRRKFLTTAAAATAGLAPLAPVSAGEPKTEPPPVVQALTDIVRRRYGKHLSEAQLKSVQQAIVGDQAIAEALRRVRLENADEPAFTFIPEVE